MHNDSNNSSTIDQEEVAKFASLSEEWWNPNGKLRSLHMINPTRLLYVRSKIEEHFSQEFKELSVLDVGCGGGLVSVPMKRLGFDVTAIDAAEENIKTAQYYTKSQNLDINYKHSTIEELSEEDKKYDIILSLEVIEHVANPEEFVSYLSRSLRPGGLMILSTINRTTKALLLAKIAAEYILRWAPIGTHEFDKFVKPSELYEFLSSSGLKVKELKGLSYSILQNNWRMSEEMDINYFVTSYI